MSRQYYIDLGWNVTEVETGNFNRARWEKGNLIIQSLGLVPENAGTGFGMRDMQIDVASEEEGKELVDKINKAFEDADLRLGYIGVTYEEYE